MSRIMCSQTRVTVCLLAAGMALGATPRSNPAAFGPGDILWTRTYEGARPAAMAVDSAGNSYITSYTNSAMTGDDIITIKYGPEGTQLWANTYNLVSNMDDQGTNVAVDGAGEVFVCGWSGIAPNSQFTTIKYNAGGQQLWAVQWPGGNSASAPTGVAVDDSGNCYVTGVSAESIGAASKAATIKYDGDGRPVWVALLDDSFANGSANAIVVDAHRNAYICGTFTLHDTSYIVAVAYNTGGRVKWVGRYKGPGRTRASGEFLAVDASGNVYVAGISMADTIPPAGDITPLKFDSTGRQLWVKQYPGTHPAGLGLDATGVYVTGNGTVSGHGLDYITIKYGLDGDSLWASRYGEPGQADLVASDMALDDRGYVYLTGSGGSSGWVTARVAPGGRQDWHSSFGDTTDAGGVAIGLDALRHIYVTGYSHSTTTGYDIVTMKYDSLPLGVAEVPRGRLAIVGDLRVTPNPVTVAAHIQYSVPSAGPFSLNLYDAAGSLVRTLVRGRMPAGYRTADVRLDRLAAGIYLLRLMAAGGSATSKLVLQ